MQGIMLICGVYSHAQSPYHSLSTSIQGTDNVVRAKLRQVALGNGAIVRAELPDLMKSYPGDPGIQFLNATMLADGNKALPLFTRIVREHPESIWADDAQWRVVQIYALRKDTLNARSELQFFRKNYPASEFLLFAAEIVKSTVGLPPSFGINRPSIVISSPPASSAAAAPIPQPSSAQVGFAASTQPLSTASDTRENKVNSHSVEERSSSGALYEESRFALQVGLYATRASADEEVERFKKARMKASIVEKQLEGASKYAVTVGNYSTREAADKAKPTVQKICNCVPFVIPR